VVVVPGKEGSSASYAPIIALIAQIKHGENARAHTLDEVALVRERRGLLQDPARPGLGLVESSRVAVAVSFDDAEQAAPTSRTPAPLAEAEEEGPDRFARSARDIGSGGMPFTVRRSS